MRIGLVTGLESEAALARRNLPAAAAPFVACAGPGPVAARGAAQRLIDAGVDGLVSFGFAGGLDRALKAGDLVVASEVRGGAGHAIACTPSLADTLAARLDAPPGVVRAPLAASGRIVATVAEKLTLHEDTGAVAADMESLAVGEAAMQAGIAFACLRAIIDTADQDLPPLAVVAAGADGRLRPWPILFSLVRHPGQVAALAPLARNSRLAENRLAAACRLAGPALAGTG